MNRRFLFALSLAGFLIAVIAALPQYAPGYMDADYYYAGGLRIAEGQMSAEPYLWNYLNEPVVFPAPAFGYWMPLTSFVAAFGLSIFRLPGLWGARIGFLLLAAIIPPLTALLGYRITNREQAGRFAGLLSLFPGFYLAYLPTTDAFSLYMVLGAVFLLLAFDRGWRWLGVQPPELRLTGLGILAGLLHMTRADGLLWLVAAAVAGLYWWKVEKLPVARLFTLGIAALIGYGMVSAAWYTRNLIVWGTPFPPGGARAMWITAYEQTMIYPSSVLTFQNWISAGLNAHLSARLDAVVQNIQTIVAVQGGIVLLPFILAGLWRLRRCPEVILGVFMWVLAVVIMTLVFPFAGKNGGFFHSGAAVQPLLWAAVPVGVEDLMTRYARWRRIGPPHGLIRFLSVLLVITGALLSAGIYQQRVIGADVSAPDWSASDRHYRQVEAELVRLGATPCEPVMVNNPPGYWLASRRSSLVIPYGDEEMLLAAAKRFGARYLVLETNDSQHLFDLYSASENRPGFEYLGEVGSTKLYRISD